MKGAPDARTCWDVSFVKLIVNNKRDVFCSSLPWGMRGRWGDRPAQTKVSFAGMLRVASLEGDGRARSCDYRNTITRVWVLLPPGLGVVSRFGHPSSTPS